MRFRILLRFAFTLVSLIALGASAKVLFHSDFECGETHAASQIPAGAKSIDLLLNSRLEEWPVGGGKGLVEGNHPDRCEEFSYRFRRGTRLNGVKGISRDHPKWSSVLRVAADGWDAPSEANTGFPRARHDRRLFGEGCAEFLQGSASAVLRKEIPDSLRAFHFRCYLLFSDAFFHNQDIATTLFRAGFSGQVVARVDFVKKGTSEVGRLVLHGDKGTLRERTGDRPVFLEANRKYLVELSAGPAGGREVSIRLWVDDALQIMRETRVGADQSAGRPMICFGGPETAQPVHGEMRFWVDEVAISDSAIGGIPETAALRFRDGKLVDLLPTTEESARRAGHWQIAEKNAWLLPVFDSGRDEKNPRSLLPPFVIRLKGEFSPGKRYDSSACIPTGVRPNGLYLARMRYQGENGEWGKWSVPVSFRTGHSPDTCKPPDLPAVEKTEFCLPGKREVVIRLSPGSWYDLYVWLRDPRIMKDLLFVEFNLTGQPEACETNQMVRETPHNPANHYGFSTPVHTSEVYAQETEGSAWLTERVGKQGLFVDNRGGVRATNQSEGWLRVRMRLLPQARIGPWVLKCFAASQSGRASPMHSQLFHVGKVEHGGIHHGWVWTCLLFVGGLGMAAVAVAFRRAQKKKGTKEDSVVPLDVDSRFSDKIEETAQYIRDHFHTGITPGQVAEAVFLSQHRLGVIFREGTGKTVGQYLAEVRMAQAKNLLRNTSDPVSEIALKTGFSNPNYFSEAFHELEGVTPSQFRARQRRS